MRGEGRSLQSENTNPVPEEDNEKGRKFSCCRGLLTTGRVARTHSGDHPTVEKEKPCKEYPGKKVKIRWPKLAMESSI